MLSAVVERFGRVSPTQHRVRDLSAGGVRIDQAGDLRVGATVLVSVGVLEAIGATVQWVRDGHAGLAFAEQIDPELARARAAKAPKPAETPAAGPPGVIVPKVGWAADLRNPYRKTGL